MIRTGDWYATAGVAGTNTGACACDPEELLNDATDKEGKSGAKVAFGAVAGASAINAEVEIARATSGDTRNNAFVWFFAS